MVWLKFLICFGIILIAGSRLSRYGDALAVKTGLGRAWVGMVLLAAITSLPELATGVSAVALVGKPNLTVGDVFGSNIFNLLCVAIIDIFYRKGPILQFVSTGIVLVAALSALLIAAATAAIFVANNMTPLGLFDYIGLYSPLLFLMYFGAQFLLVRFERKQQKQPVAQQKVEEKYEHLSLIRVYTFFCLSGLVVAGAGIWLGYIGEEMSDVTGLRTSLVGTLFLALATSMPELVVSLSSLRLGAPEMAVGNVVGSNLFNMGVVLFADDLFFAKGPLLSSVSTDHIFTGLMAIMMSCVVIAGLVYRPKRWGRLWLSFDAAALIVLYIITFVTLFFLSGTAAG